MIDQRDPSSLSNAIYRPPIADVEPNHSAFSADEWRYMAKIFAYWVVGGALVLSCFTTWRFHFALSQFGGQEYLGRIVALAAADLQAPSLVLAAACNALVMVTERRTKAGVTEPVQRLPGTIAIILVLLTPLVMALMLGIALACTALMVGIPSYESLRGVLKHVHPRDLSIAIAPVVVGAFVIVVSTPHIMRVLARFQGWLLLKYLAFGLMCQVLAGVVGGILGALQATLT